MESSKTWLLLALVLVAGCSMLSSRPRCAGPRYTEQYRSWSPDGAAIPAEYVTVLDVR